VHAVRIGKTDKWRERSLEQERKKKTARKKFMAVINKRHELNKKNFEAGMKSRPK
jgi:hypothetical protein